MNDWYAVAIGYLSGTLPAAFLLCKVIYKKDIRTVGSGNPGTTNVFRVFGWKPALVVLVLDMLKGMIPVLLVFECGLNSALFAAFSAFLGHVFPFYAPTKGGKGVATAAGSFIILAPVPLIVSLAVYALIVCTLKIGSLASLAGALTLCMSSFFMAERSVFYFSMLLTLSILLTHRSNIQKLWKGSETKVNRNPKDMNE